MRHVDSSILSRRFPDLSAREADILSGIASGMANADIGTMLGITERTVKNTLSGIPFKVGFSPEDCGGSLRVRLALRAHGIL
jgi:DNA-binding NarL/FixJ family response regulator